MKSLNWESILSTTGAALMFAAFIYLAHVDLSLPYVESLFAVIAFYFILQGDRKQLLLFGAMTGLLWFYWISFSFRYYDLAFLIPLMLIFLAGVYGILFYLLSLLHFPAFRALGLLGFSYVHPFGFNWFKPELALINTPFDTDKLSFALILAGVLAIIHLKHYWRFLAIIPLFCALHFPSPAEAELPNLSIRLTQTSIPQDQKWKPQNLEKYILENQKLIEEAVAQKYDLIILPESAFPTYINVNPKIQEMLESYSHSIAIVAGGLHLSDGKLYNSAYHFEDGEMHIADKVVLVPFGEKIPLPDFLVDVINDLFFNGAEDYAVASSPTDFRIKGQLFRNAICYEATDKKLYSGAPKYMIAISNNAWFLPSIEATYQNLLMHYFADQTGTVIFHSANGQKSAVITPRN